MQTDIDNEEKNIRSHPGCHLELATQIMAGLLASGHYTEMVEEEDTPRPHRLDVGKEWKEVGSRQRFICHAVEDAVSLLKDLEDEVSAKFPAPRPLTVPPGYQILPGGQWQRRHLITGKWVNAESPHSRPVEDLVAGIDFPHTRDGGQWRQKKPDRLDEPASTFQRACHYAR